MKSIGRRRMAQECRGKKFSKPLHQMRGHIPSAVEEDKQFFQLFQMSKDLEKVVMDLKDEAIPDIAAIRAAQDAFNGIMVQLRGRWFELVPEDRPS